MLSPRTVDYLETIYLLSLENDTVGVTQVAAGRSVTIPTARAAVGRLKDEGYVRQERYGKIVLTDKGRERARTVYRSHTVLFRFLHEVLGVAPDCADDEACRLEHGLSQDTLAKLIRFLNDGAGSTAAGEQGTGGK
jgi:DtxR family Mn-dependent transcriptional regulator